MIELDLWASDEHLREVQWLFLGCSLADLPHASY